MKINCSYTKLVPLSELKPHPKNRNKHPADQIKRLCKLIEHHGVRHPIIVSNLSGCIVAGHGRLAALTKLGVKEAPVDFQDFKDAEEEYTFLQSDNAVALWAELDQLAIIDDMKDMAEFDLELLGFKDFQLPSHVEPGCDEDEVPEVKEPRTVLGDIYELGSHRVMCGDSTMIDQVEKLMNGEKSDMVFTSPPYNAATKVGEGDIFNGKKAKKLYADGYSDKLSSDEYLDFTKSVLNICFLVTEGFIFWNVSYNSNSRYEYISQIYEHLPSLIEQICWKKSSTIPFKGSLMRDWEPIYIFSTKREKLGLETVTSNHWEISNTHSQQESHKACFPVALPEKGILLVKSKNGIVFEPFCGSGSTLIACEKTQRKCYGMELDPHYCDVIVSRYCKYSGNNNIKLNGKEITWNA